MNTLLVAGGRSRKPVRIAVTAAALGVIGCFAAAFTFAQDIPTSEPVLVVEAG